MNTKAEKEKQIMGELSELSWDIIEMLTDLQAVEFDSPSTKAKLKDMLSAYWELNHQMNLLDDS